MNSYDAFGSSPVIGSSIIKLFSPIRKLRERVDKNEEFLERDWNRFKEVERQNRQNECANKEICKVKEKIEQLNKDLVNTTDKKESLKIQLAIVEQEDKIENLRKKIAENENAKANHFTRVAKVVGDIENKLNELIANNRYDIK